MVLIRDEQGSLFLFKTGQEKNLWDRARRGKNVKCAGVRGGAGQEQKSERCRGQFDQTENF